MSDDRKPLQNFNIDTMSGVYPGSRTRTYQRLRLHQSDGSPVRWYQLHWTEHPARATLHPVDVSPLTEQAVVMLDAPDRDDFLLRLYRALAEQGLCADACFACQHWQPQHERTDDRVPAGRCTWRNDRAELPAALSTQSALSLACAHFARAAQPPQHRAAEPAAAQSVRVPKSADFDPDRLPFWPRLWHRMRRRTQNPSAVNAAWAAGIIERSGVGAGTEPCFVCQGRLANLGALVVASDEGDKQTLSVWRCRRCYTLFLNDWTDRWERLENLETEERYFRLAPQEAFVALRIIHATVDAEHPARRRDRDQERAAVLALVVDQAPLSHQIRQGR